MIVITGHPIRHKKRIQEIQARFLDSNADVEVIYKNIDHIIIKNENRKGKDKQYKNKS